MSDISQGQYIANPGLSGIRKGSNDNSSSSHSSSSSLPKPIVSPSSLQTPDDRQALLISLALEALDESRTSLMMAFRFMDAALWLMPFEAARGDLPLATEGKTLAYDPKATLIRFKESPNELTRDMLHSIMHCIFRHPLDASHPHREAWSLSCDIVVEAICAEMCSKRYTSDLDEEREEAIASLRMLFGVLTPYKLYRVFDKALHSAGVAASLGLDFAFISTLKVLFLRDSHDMWLNGAQTGKDLNPEQTELADPSQSSDDSDDSDIAHSLQSCGSFESSREAPKPEEGGDSRTGDSDEFCRAGEGEDIDPDAQSSDSDDDTFQGQAKSGSQPQAIDQSSDKEDDSPEFELTPEQERTVKEWEEIAKRIEADLATYSRAWGEESGDLMANLQVANRDACDYSDFLRKFATVAEDMRLNDDEFDYLFYLYGLEHYGNMPLVEPLEYVEQNRVREFVIALDTSGSCSGDLLKRFVAHTYNILKGTQNFGDEVNIHILQADSRVQIDKKITSLGELNEFEESFLTRGYGGTDFRPVFKYVDELIEQGEFENLRGLVYFTDGLGTYPKKQPDFDTAFIFLDDDAEERNVPPWAMKAIITHDTVRSFIYRE